MFHLLYERLGLVFTYCHAFIYLHKLRRNNTVPNASLLRIAGDVVLTWWQRDFQCMGIVCMPWSVAKVCLHLHLHATHNHHIHCKH